MSKKSKKRAKKYSGWEAREDESIVTVHKVTAVNRSPLKQWIFDHKKILKVVGVSLIVAIVIVLAFAVSL